MMRALSLGLSMGSRQAGASAAFTSYSWAQTTADTGYPARDGPGAAFFGGYYWLWGGWDGNGLVGALKTTNQVLRSADAATWTEALAHDDSPPTSGPGARPKRRHTFGFEPFTHNGIPYMYILGGDHESSGDGDFAASDGMQCDVWRTTDPGSANAYERVLASGDAPWQPNILVVFGTSPGRIWAFGGIGSITTSPTASNALYVSTNGGFTWSTVWAHDAGSVTHPSPRGIINRMVFWHGRMWIVGGGTYDDNPALRTYCRDVWSFDPDNPTDVTQHETPPWEGVEYHSVEVFQGRLFVMGGYADSANTRTVWSTADGDRWDRHETPPWSTSHADGTCVNGNKLLRIAGNGDLIQTTTMHAYFLTATPEANEVTLPTPRGVWDMATAARSGANITSVADSGGGGGPALVPGSVTGDATYTASSAVLGGKPAAVSDGGFFLKTASAVNLASFELFIVARPANTAGGYYYAYALTGSDYFYVYAAPSGTGNHKGLIEIGVARGGTTTSGSDTSALDVGDVMHIYSVRYDGTAAGSGVFLDGARTVPGETPLVNDAGTGTFNATLFIQSANDASGDKSGPVGEVRLYPLLTDAQRGAVVRQLRAKFPYAYP